MQNKKGKTKKKKNFSDSLVFWITIIGFIITVSSFIQNSSYKFLILVAAISLCVVCTIISFFRAKNSDEHEKHNNKRIEQIKKEVSEGKVPSDSYFFNKNTKDKGFIIDILYIKAHILYEVNSYDFGVTYTWKAICHLSNPEIIPQYITCQIAGDCPITDNSVLNIKAIIRDNNKKSSMKVDIEDASINQKTKNLKLIIPNGFFNSQNSLFNYTLSYTWPRSYHPPRDRFSFFIEKENNSKTYETHIRIFGNKQCFSTAFYEISDSDFKPNKTELSIFYLKNDEIGVTLDISKGTKEKMIYITTEY